MFTVACCSVVGLGLGLDLVSGWLVGYAHVFVLVFGCHRRTVDV